MWKFWIWKTRSKWKVSMGKSIVFVEHRVGIYLGKPVILTEIQRREWESMFENQVGIESTRAMSWRYLHNECMPCNESPLEVFLVWFGFIIAVESWEWYLQKMAQTSLHWTEWDFGGKRENEDKICCSGPGVAGGSAHNGQHQEGKQGVDTRVM